jgi:hypothetical protein
MAKPSHPLTLIRRQGESKGLSNARSVVEVTPTRVQAEDSLC